MLELTGGETVLEVGTGCGYAAAVLGALAARVISVEIVPGLASLAQENLRRTGLRCRMCAVVLGDGSLGLPESAPYDAISVAAGAPDIPMALLEQLDDPGRLVIPVGDREDQELRVVEKARRQDRLRVRDALPLRSPARRRGVGRMRLRTAKDRLKIEHSIIDGLRPVLEDLLAANPGNPLGDPGRDPPGARREGQGESAGHGAHAERLEGHRAERRRAPGAVHQHRLEQQQVEAAFEKAGAVTA